MGWKMTSFERERLYAEVWAEPVRTVAERYDLSDVGLRKICVKLGVPMPPLGYWARVNAGKAPRIAALPMNFKGPTTHIRRQYVDDVAPERERRVASLLAEHAPNVWPVVIVPETLDISDPVLRRTSKALSSRSADPMKMASAMGRDVFEIHVSHAEKERALRILQGCLTAFGAVGTRTVPSKLDGPPVHLEVIGQFVSFKLDELMDRSLREPTAKERADQEKYSWNKPDLRVYTPNGKLKLTVLSDDRYSNFLSVSDGVSPIADRLLDLVERVMTKAADRAIQQQMREEERQRWEEAAARRRAREAARDKELERLETTEKSVQQWHRARLLREYAAALEVSLTKRNPTNEVLAQIAWIRNAADWLDPLVEKAWLEVDTDVC